MHPLKLRLVSCALSLQKHLACRGRGLIFALHFKGGKKIVRADFSDLVAQLVEHNTFNVGALGSSPSGITKALSGSYFLIRNLKLLALIHLSILQLSQKWQIAL